MASIAAEIAAVAAEVARLRGALDGVERRLTALAGTAAAETATVAPVAPAMAVTVAAPPPVPVMTMPVQPSAAAASAVTADNSAPGGADEAMLARLERLHADLQAAGIVIDPAEVAFLVHARRVVGEAGPAKHQRIAELVGLMDRLESAWLGEAWKPLRDGLAEARALAAAALPGWKLLQAQGISPDAQVINLPLSARVVASTGISDADGRVLSPAVAILPTPAATPLAAAAGQLVEEIYASLRRTWRKPVRDELPQVIGDLRKLTAADDLVVARAIFNAHAKATDGAESPAAQGMVSVLRQRGILAFRLAAGESFDPDRHDIKRYERVMVAASGQAPGTVLAVRQWGMTDAAGTTVQKCLALVAS